jgi:hypothetical protein
MPRGGAFLRSNWQVFENKNLNFIHFASAGNKRLMLATRASVGNKEFKARRFARRTQMNRLRDQIASKTSNEVVRGVFGI